MAAGSDRFVPGATSTVPSASPSGISPAGSAGRARRARPPAYREVPGRRAAFANLAREAEPTYHGVERAAGERGTADQLGCPAERIGVPGCRGSEGRQERSVRRLIIGAVIAVGLAGAVGCAGSGASTDAERTTPAPGRREQDGRRPVSRGQPIDVTGLEGRVLFDDFEDVYVMEADGTHVRPIAERQDPSSMLPGPLTVGRSSTGIAPRDQRERRDLHREGRRGPASGTLTRNPANDWGPDWSPDGQTIAFNSDRDGGSLRGYLVSPDGSNLRRLDADVWFEYPTSRPTARRSSSWGMRTPTTTSTSPSSRRARLHD